MRLTRITALCLLVATAAGCHSDCNLLNNCGSCSQGGCGNGIFSRGLFSGGIFRNRALSDCGNCDQGMPDAQFADSYGYEFAANEYPADNCGPCDCGINGPYAESGVIEQGNWQNDGFQNSETFGQAQTIQSPIVQSLAADEPKAEMIPVSSFREPSPFESETTEPKPERHTPQVFSAPAPQSNRGLVSSSIIDASELDEPESLEDESNPFTNGSMIDDTDEISVDAISEDDYPVDDNPFNNNSFGNTKPAEEKIIEKVKEKVKALPVAAPVELETPALKPQHITPLAEPPVDRIARAPQQQVVQQDVILRARPSINHSVSPEYEAFVAGESQRQAVPTIQASSRHRVDEFGLPADKMEFRPLPGENHPSLRKNAPELGPQDDWIPEGENRNHGAIVPGGVVKGELFSDNILANDRPETSAQQPAGIIPFENVPKVDIDLKIQQEVERRLREILPANQVQPTDVPAVEANVPPGENLTADTVKLRAIPRTGDQVGNATFRNVSHNPAAIGSSATPSTGSMPNILNVPNQTRQQDNGIQNDSILIDDLPPVPQQPLYDYESVQRRIGLTERPETQKSALELIER